MVNDIGVSCAFQAMITQNVYSEIGLFNCLDILNEEECTWVSTVPKFTVYVGPNPSHDVQESVRHWATFKSVSDALTVSKSTVGPTMMI